jgi:GAF domain-containing protein
MELASAVRDPARIVALRRLVVLDTGPTEALDRIARLTARILECPIALITLVDADRQYFKASFGLPAALESTRETPLTWSICQYAVALRAPLVVCDAGVEHWLDDNRAITEFGVKAYAGVPLISRDGYAIGTLCAIDLSPRQWADDELANLEDLADMAIREIYLHRLERQVAHQRLSKRA